MNGEQRNHKKPMVCVGVRMPEHLRDRIGSIARDERRTLSQTTLMLVEKGLERIERA